MATPEAAPRPRQVTLAAALVMAGSGLLVVSVFERLAGLRSLETRTSMERFLREPPGSDLGIGLESMLDILRTVSMVAAGLATAAAILGFHLLKRNRSARIGLSVLALPLFLTGLVTGGFLASVVAASVAMLWLQPARGWFRDGTVPEGPPVVGTARHDAGLPPLAAPPPFDPDGRSGASGADPTTGVSGAPPAWAPYATPEALTPDERGHRPGSLVTACVVTWVSCALGGLFAILMIAVLAADPQGLFAEMHRQNPALADDGITDSALRTAAWVAGIGGLVWALFSGGLAVLVWQRVRWARPALVVSAGTVALSCLAGSLLSPVLAVPGVLAALTAVLLLQASVQRWFARPRVSRDVMRP